jgi:hypothetical protein
LTARKSFFLRFLVRRFLFKPYSLYTRLMAFAEQGSLKSRLSLSAPQVESFFFSETIRCSSSADILWGQL